MENLKKAFWKLQYEKNIQIFDDGGWHFNNLYDAETISTKLRNIQNVDKGLKNVNTEIDIIKNKMSNLEDVFNRNHKYEKITIDEKYPKYIRNNLGIFKDFILK